MNLRTTEHTTLDHQALTEAGIDPSTTEPRHQRVLCISCRRQTANIARGCDLHYIPHPLSRLQELSRRPVTV